MPQSIAEQIRRNIVAIISLIVAVSSLAYNTYRNELTESNRTIRQAGFEMISELSKLQQVMLFARYDQKDERGDTTVAWSHMLALQDLSLAMPKNIQEQTEKLFKTWQANYQKISHADDSAYKMIDVEIDSVKDKIISSISKLN